MIEEYQLRVLPETAASEQALRRHVAREKGKDERTLTAIRVLKRSIDARQRTIYVNLKVRVYVNEQPEDDEFVRTEYRDVSGRPQVIVVGAGPGGLFAALRLIEAGCRPVVVERGKNVRDRKLDLAKISREHKVDSESNYSFGEGGAGAYSDGKLYTRSKKRGNVEKILNVFCQHGASVSILQDRVLPARRQRVHPAGRPSAHRDGQTPEGHREHAQDHPGLRGRGAFRDPHGRFAHRERRGGRD